MGKFRTLPLDGVSRIFLKALDDNRSNPVITQKMQKLEEVVMKRGITSLELGAGSVQAVVFSEGEIRWLKNLYESII
jgi:hypothetical protein